MVTPPDPDYPFDIRYMWRDKTFVRGRFGEVHSGVPLDTEVIGQRQPHSHHMENLLWWLGRCTERASMTGVWSPERFNGVEWETFSPQQIQPNLFGESGWTITPTGSLYGYPMDLERVWVGPRTALSGLFDRQNIPIDGRVEITNPIIANTLYLPNISSHPWGYGVSPYDGGFFPQSPYYQDTVDPSGKYLNIGQLGMVTDDTHAQIFPPENMTVESSGIFGGLALSVIRRYTFESYKTFIQWGNAWAQQYPSALEFYTAGKLVNGDQAYGSQTALTNSHETDLLLGYTPNVNPSSYYGDHYVGEFPTIHRRTMVNVGQTCYNDVGGGGAFNPNWEQRTDSIINQNSETWLKLRTYGAYVYPIRNYRLRGATGTNPSFTLDLTNPTAYHIRAEYDTMPIGTGEYYGAYTENVNPVFRVGGNNRTQVSSWDNSLSSPVWWYEEAAYNSLDDIWYNSCKWFPIDYKVTTLYPFYQPGVGNAQTSGTYCIVGGTATVGHYQEHVDDGLMELGYYYHPTNLFRRPLDLNQLAISGSGVVGIVHGKMNARTRNMLKASPEVSGDILPIIDYLGTTDTFVMMQHLPALKEAMKYIAGVWLFGDIFWTKNDDFGDPDDPELYGQYPLGLTLCSTGFTGSGNTGGDGKWYTSRETLTSPIWGVGNGQRIAFASGHPDYETMATNLGNWIVDNYFLKRNSVDLSPAQDNTNLGDGSYVAEFPVSGVGSYYWREDFNNPYGIAVFNDASNIGDYRGKRKHVGGGWVGPRKSDDAQFWPGNDVAIPQAHPSSVGILPAINGALYTGLNRRLATLADVEMTDWPNEWGPHFAILESGYNSSIKVLPVSATDGGSLNDPYGNRFRGYTVGHGAFYDDRTFSQLGMRYGVSGQLEYTQRNVTGDSAFFAEGLMVNAGLTGEAFPTHIYNPITHLSSRWSCWLSYVGEFSLKEKFGLTSSGNIVLSHYISSAGPIRIHPDDGSRYENKVDEINVIGDTFGVTTPFGFYQNTQKMWNPWNCSYKMSYGWYQMPQGNVMQSGNANALSSPTQMTHMHWGDYATYVICSGIEQGLYDGSLSVTTLVERDSLTPTIVFEKGVDSWGDFERIETDIQTMLEASPPFPSAVFFLAQYPDPIRVVFPSGTIKSPYYNQKSFITGKRTITGETGLWCRTEPVSTAFHVNYFPGQAPDSSNGNWHYFDWKADTYDTWNNHNVYPNHVYGILGVKSGEYIQIPIISDTGRLVNPEQSGVAGFAFTHEHLYSFITESGGNNYRGILGFGPTADVANSVSNYQNPYFGDFLQKSSSPWTINSIFYPGYTEAVHASGFPISVGIPVASSTRIQGPLSSNYGGLGMVAGPVYPVSDLAP